MSTLNRDAETAAALARAKAYPYAFPPGSYRYVDGTAQPLTCFSTQGRVPVLAVGSNRAPQQLARKYAGWPAGTEIPVTVGMLGDHDVVYSGHFTTYGSIPAKLSPAHGVRVEIAITWLDEAQLRCMHETEGRGNYRYAAIDGIDLRLQDGRRLDRVFAYTGRRGALSRGGTAIPLSAIAAVGRQADALSQEDVLTLARDRLAPGAALDAFILETIGCPETRTRRTAALAALSL